MTRKVIVVRKGSVGSLQNGGNCQRGRVRQEVIQVSGKPLADAVSTDTHKAELERVFAKFR